MASLHFTGPAKFVGCGWEKLGLAALDVEEAEVDGGDDTTAVDAGAEVEAERLVFVGGKASPILRGRGRTGPEAVPTTCPCLGKT